MSRAIPLLRRLTFIFCTFTLVGLSACGGGMETGPVVKEEHAAVAPANTPSVKVALLVPLTGKNAELGKSLMNAAQMALFDVGSDNFELLPGDTKGTAEGAATAAYNAVQSGAQLILGPVFSEEVKAAKPAAAHGNVNMIAFSTDWELADGHTFLMGFTPFDQIDRITAYAAGHGLKRIGIVAPDNAYGTAVTPAYQKAAARLGIETPQSITIQPGNPESSGLLRQFALNGSNLMDGVFMPMGSNAALDVSRTLNSDGLLNTQARRLGTELFDDPMLAKAPEMQGAWFAAPAPLLRKDFERRFLQTYSYSAPRLATLAYDATALAAALAQRGAQTAAGSAFDTASITNANGFSGLDGIFRFHSNGLAERGLAVLEFRNNSIGVVDPAPASFQNF